LREQGELSRQMKNCAGKPGAFAGSRLIARNATFAKATIRLHSRPTADLHHRPVAGRSPGLIWRWPISIAAQSVFGLLAALISQIGISLPLSWIALTMPLAVAAICIFRWVEIIRPVRPMHRPTYRRDSP
jgi:hypothetical protein